METRTYTIEKPAKKKSKKGCLIPLTIFGALIIIGIALGGGEESPKTGSNDSAKTSVEIAVESAEEVDYKALHQDYMDNAIAADAQYKDKMLILTGEVGDIDREIAGNPYVTFDIDDFLHNVRITFNKDEEEKVAKFAKGQTITIVGKCRGTILSTTVSMDDCLLIE